MRLFPLLLLVCLALVAGCSGAPKKYVFPPQARIQQLQVADDGHWLLTLRLHNYSNVPMRFSRVEAELAIDAITAGTLVHDGSIDVSANSVELVTLQLPPAPAAGDRVADALATGSGIGYRLSGRIVSADPRGDYPFEFSSRLDRVPGLDRVLR